MVNKTKILFPDFLKKAKEIHGEKYDYSNVVYIDYHKKIEIICHIHGSFWQLPSVHIYKKSGCKKCSDYILSKLRTSNTQEFVRKAKLRYGDKYDYSLVDYKTAKENVKIICPIHGIIEQFPNNHLRGKVGCCLCGIESNKKSQPKLKTTEQFIKQAIFIHGKKYDYSLINYIGDRKNVKIICPIHGVFEQRPNNHLQGKICSKCARNKKLTTQEFINRSIQIHGYRFDYNEVNYINGNAKVKIICKIHGMFLQKPEKHLIGHICPKCVNLQYPKGEQLIEKYLKESNINYESQKRFTKSIISRCKFDFYLQDYKLLVEFNGMQHYQKVSIFGSKPNSFQKQQLRDKRKRNFAFRNGYNLLEIPYFVKDPIKLIEQKIVQIKILSKRKSVNNQLQLSI